MKTIITSLILTIFLVVLNKHDIIDLNARAEYKRVKPIETIIIAKTTLKVAKSSSTQALKATTSLDKLLTHHFGNNAKIAKAILMQESSLNPKAINYNCYYYKNQIRYSTTCRRGDEIKAWSVDCGLSQLNHKGQVCPEWTFVMEKNIEKMSDMYQKRGWNCWVAYTSKSYLKYM